MVGVSRVRFSSDDPLVQNSLQVADDLRRHPRVFENVTYSLDIAMSIEERVEGEGLPAFDDELGWVS